MDHQHDRYENVVVISLSFFAENKTEKKKDRKHSWRYNRFIDTSEVKLDENIYDGESTECLEKKAILH